MAKEGPAQNKFEVMESIVRQRVKRLRASISKAISEGYDVCPACEGDYARSLDCGECYGARLVPPQKESYDDGPIEEEDDGDGLTVIMVCWTEPID